MELREKSMLKLLMNQQCYQELGLKESLRDSFLFAHTFCKPVVFMETTALRVGVRIRSACISPLPDPTFEWDIRAPLFWFVSNILVKSLLVLLCDGNQKWL